MAGIDGSVEALAAPDVIPEGIGVDLMSRMGEPIGFAIVGITGGLLTGYFWNEIRRKT